MSSYHRKLARLPLGIFTNLLDTEDDEDDATMTPTRLRQEICSKLEPNITTVGDLLVYGTLQLLHILDPLLTYHECLEFEARLCRVCAPKPRTAWQLLNQEKGLAHMRTGMPLLDDGVLMGGLRVGTISEVVGRAGVGKTQFAMQLCCALANSGENAGSIYIDTEQKLSLARFQEMAGGGGERMILDNDKQEQHSKKILETITVHSPSSMDELLQTVNKLEDVVLELEDERPVKLIVLDSIAAPFLRKSFSNAEKKGPTESRTELLMDVAQTLKRIADQFDLAVLVVNQVGSVVGEDNTIRAALGTPWHHCLSTRILLEQGVEGTRRASLVKSHIAPNRNMSFEITSAGLEQIEGSIN